jgi:hypothetical protein
VHDRSRSELLAFGQQSLRRSTCRRGSCTPDVLACDLFTTAQGHVSRSRLEVSMNVPNSLKAGSVVAVLTVSALLSGCVSPGSLLSKPDINSLAVGMAPPYEDPDADPPWGVFQDTWWNVYAEASVAVIPDGPAGNKALRFSGPADEAGPDGSQRAEQSPCALPVQDSQCPPLALHPGQVVWIAFDVRVNGALPHNRGHNSVFQMKTGGVPDQGSGVMGIGLNDSRGEGFYLGDAGGDCEHHSLGAVPYGRWAHVVIGMKIAIDPNEAWVEAWRDGENVMPREPWHTEAMVGPIEGTIGGTMYPGGTDMNYLKFGLYRLAADFPASFDLARLAIGTTRAAVEPPT